VTFKIHINGVATSIDITFGPSINGGIYVNGNTGAGNFTLNAGDYVDLVSPATSDGSLSDLALSIVCVADTGTP